MENNISKETKRRFFRKTGSVQKSSLDTSSSPSPTQSRTSSMGPSFENPYSSIGGGMSSSLMNSPRSSMSVPVRPGTGNSISLDETEIKMSRHHHFMAAPRRARSAERFDGMRIAFPNTSGDAQALAALRDELLARHRGSPQTTRSLNNGLPLPARLPQQQQQQKTQFQGMTSPPPPYAAAVTEVSGSGPPSYRQAVAAATMTLPSAPPMGGKKGKLGYAMPNRGTQSFDTNLGLSRSSLRSATSVPAFTDDVICSCSKCQVLKRPSDMGQNNNGEYGNDAVYMESQAFLMHEIMTDGMAFCSIT